MVANNRLTGLPDSFCKLTLLELDLSRQPVRELSPSRCWVSSASAHCNLASNQLPDLPLAITQLARLRTISLQGNPFTYGPEFLGVCDEPGAAVFVSAAVLVGCKRPLNEAKLIMVGEAMAGKTSR